MERQARGSGVDDARTDSRDGAPAEAPTSADVGPPAEARRPPASPRREPSAPPPQQAAATAPDERGARDADKRQRQRARTRRRRLLFFFVVLAILLGGGGFAWWEFVASRFESTDDAYVDGEIVRVSPQIEGVLVDVPVRENAAVTPGDLLARIDPAEVDADLAVATAQLEQARTGVGSAAAELAQARAQVTAQTSARDAASVRYENAKALADRYQTLKGRSGSLAISQQQVDDAVAAAREAEATLKQADATVLQAEAAATTAEAELATAKAAVDAAAAAVEQAKVQAGYLAVTAQISGQVVQVGVNKGSYVAPGSQMMAIVPDHLYVTANFKETQLDGIRVGQSVDVTVDAYPEVKFKGRVDSVQHGAGQAFALLPPQNATGNFVKVVQRVPVRIEIEGTPSFRDYPIGPGMSVVPRVHIK